MIAQMMISDADQQVHAACQRNCSENAECSCYSSKDDGYCKLGRNCEGLTYTGSGDDNRWVFGSCSGSTHMQTNFLPLHARGCWGNGSTQKERDAVCEGDLV